MSMVAFNSLAGIFTVEALASFLFLFIALIVKRKNSKRLDLLSLASVFLGLNWLFFSNLFDLERVTFLFFNAFTALLFLTGAYYAGKHLKFLTFLKKESLLVLSALLVLNAAKGVLFYAAFLAVLLVAGLALSSVKLKNAFYWSALTAYALSISLEALAYA